MRWHALLLATLTLSCSTEDKPSLAPQKSSEKGVSDEKSKDEADAKSKEKAGVERPDESAGGGGGATDTPDGESENEGESEGENEGEGSEATFVVDPETLSFPVVFHLGDSEAWTSEESLKAVLAETQRILLQAKIEIIPSFTRDPASTDFLDVTYTPEVPNNPGVNGISFGGADLEVFVKDKVGLGKVADERPLEAALGRTFKDAKPGDSIPVGQQEARQARTTAHEIGHQLGLPHRQDSTNLMASGTTGWTMNESEISTVRATAIRKFKAKFLEKLP